MHWKIIIPTGASNAAMSILMMYSANPIRTPVLIQSIFLGLAILSSILFSKLLLNKHTYYDIPCALISILFLLGSVAIAIIPVATDPNLEEAEKITGWSIMFLFGVFAYSLTNVLQEKYIRQSEDDTFDNKIYLALTSSIFQSITIIMFSWVDIFIGYNPVNGTGFELFVNSFRIMVTDLWVFCWLFVFIALWFLLFVIAVFLHDTYKYHQSICSIILRSIPQSKSWY